jgi:HAD superfamily hydrolase (TIGR01490 family)
LLHPQCRQLAVYNVIAGAVYPMNVAFFDIGGTLVKGEPWRYMVKHPCINQVKVKLAYARFMPFWMARRLGLSDDVVIRDRLMRQLAWLLKGLSRTETDTLFDWVVYDNMQQDFFPAVVERIRQHQQNGERVVLVSGIFDVLVKRFAAYVGADDSIGTTLAYQNDVCTGKLTGDTIAGEQKVQVIRHYLQQNGLPTDLSQHYAYADSYSDLPMLSAVGHPVAVYPEAQLLTIAVSRGWTMLTAH